MNIAKVQTLTTLVAYHEGEFEEAKRKVASIRAELTKAETVLIGAKEELRNAKMALEKANSSIPIREVTVRERDIARLLGGHLVVGEDLSEQVWSEICEKRCS